MRDDDLADIGPYRFIERLGHGGMGSVWLAEQLEPVRRNVAVKVIHASALGSLDRALFEVERQTLARMSHPCVAQVFDAGRTDDGRPWFAMEWVPGEPITDYCDRRELGMRERIELFVRVCLGVQHAHQRGIIHRDLKPGNVLVREVDREHLPKIIDFGVATSVYDDGHGQRPTNSDRVGTRAYMSPEQNSGDAGRLDTRSDVYALGVMLFELLSGERPPDATDDGTLHTFHRALTGRGTPGAGGGPTVPQQAFAAAAALDRELRCILGRALAPDRDRRYPSCDDLARDLKRHLAGEVVEAVPASRAYRWRKFMVRHRVAIGAGSLAALALVAGLLLALWGLLEAQAERDRARLAAARAEQTAAFVTGMLNSIDPAYASGEDTTLLRRVLDDAAERAAGELSGQPEVLAEISLTIGQSYKAIGEDVAAEGHLARASELSAALEDRARLNLRARNQHAELQARLGRAERGLEMSEELVARAAAMLEPHDRVRLQIRSVYAHLLQQRGRHDDAEAAIRPVIEATRSLDDPEYFEIRVDALRTLAQLHSDRMQLDRAHAAYRDVLEAVGKRDDAVARIHRASALNDQAVVYLRQQRYAEAEPLLREALILHRELYGDDHPMTRSVVSNLGGSLRQQGRPDDALPFYREAHRGFLEQYGPAHPRTLIAQYNLGNCYRDLGRHEEAITLQREALATAKHVVADNAFLLGNFHLGLGRSELAGGNPAEAEVLLNRAEELISEAAGPDHYRAAEAREYRGRARTVLRDDS